MPEAGPISITHRKLIAVEGLDEKNFFDKLLHHIGITDFQIEDVGGKDQFPKRFPALLRTPGFVAPDGSAFVTHLAIVRDKDEDNAFQSITSIVARSGLTPPSQNAAFSGGTPKVGIFIMPGSKAEGTMLEDLCLKTVKSHCAMPCVNDFAACVSALADPPKNIAKSKVQCFLAAQPEIVPSLGLGAQRGYWDFDSPALEELKGFLDHLK